MSIKTPAELKAKFETGDLPTAADFVDLIDSFLHAGLGNFPATLPACSGANLTNLSGALPNPLPAISGENLTNINPEEYNTPAGMPAPNYATSTSFVVNGDWTGYFLSAQRVSLTVSGAEFVTEVDSSTYAGGITTVNLLNAMPSAQLTAARVSVIRPTASGGGVSPQSIGLGHVNSSIFTTGDVKVTIKTVADDGWVMLNDGTIGNAASGGTTRANADTAALFALLWANTSDANCPVSGGRGASASADFAANKNIALPKTLGRALAIAGAGSGLTARALAEALGAETHVLTTNEMPAHSHGIGSWSNGTTAGGGNLPSNSETIQSTSKGGGAAHNNMQPTTFLKVMIKL